MLIAALIMAWCLIILHARLSALQDSTIRQAYAFLLALLASDKIALQLALELA